MERPVAHPWFSRFYRWSEWAVEQAVGEARRAQNIEAQGRTLVLGAGTGLDVPALLEATRDVWLLEPDSTMRRWLGERYPNLPLVDAPGESMPFDDAMFDTVVSSLVLCSVQDVSRVLEEIGRVLKPGGQFLFLEHVASPHLVARAAQQALTPAWKRVGGGCRLARDVVAAIRRSPLQLVSVTAVRENPLLPVIRGRALRPAD
jgi:ubiquinone/menaquinone biosynthesis C-methylase UbiE